MRNQLIVIVCVLAFLVVYMTPPSIQTRPPPAPPVVVVVDQPVFEQAKKETPLIIRIMYGIARDESVDVWDGLLKLGDLYKRGEYPLFLPNNDIAVTCYRAVALRCPDALVKATAHAKIFEDDVSIEDRAGMPLPEDPAAILLLRASKTKPATSKTKAVSPPPHPPIEKRMDLQNVHDHGVMASLKRNVQRMGDGDDDDDHEHIKEAVEEAIFACTDISDEDKMKALHVVDSLASDVTHSSLEISEKEALTKTWHHISRLEDPLVRANARDTLVKQLASGVQHGCVVCSTGKIARIVGALDGIDETQTLAKPMWAVREELGSLASRVRNDMLSKGSSPHYSDDLASKMRETFEKEATAVYIDTLGMSPKVVNPLISVYAEAF